VTPYGREIFERIMRPMVARGEVEIWHHPRLLWVYRVRRPMPGLTA